MTAKGRADFKVWAYIDNITDLANMSGYVPQNIQDVMDVAVTWQHCFGGAEGSCSGAKNKIIADRALINKAGLDGKVDLVYLFQTFGMGSGSGYSMPTLSDMQTWDCQFIATNALDGFMYYTWGAWYTTDLINHPELWPEMNRVSDSCINGGTSTPTAIPTATSVPTPITQLYPPDGSQTCQRPQVGAELIPSDVSSTLTLTLDGNDVTAAAVILQTMVTPASLTTIIYIPTNDLGLGVHQAVLTYPSGSGPQIQPWSFTVTSISCQGSPPGDHLQHP